MAWCHDAFSQRIETMKTSLLITAAMVATLSPIAASAQTAELDRGRQDVREERRELEEAKRYGTRDDVREERREYREAKQEYREDWRDYRESNREVFRGKRFKAPFRYRTFNDGVRIRTSYYSPRYYVNDYGTYRLPAPSRNQRYVRHYNDLLLVDTRRGYVVRAFRNFYW
jgi:Ni/Co efflux regulator RcnB